MAVAVADGIHGQPSRAERMEAIVAEHEGELLRYAARILNNRQSAQDVVQNVFIKLFRSWQKGTEPSDRLRGWLFRVTHNEAVDHIRRESRLRQLHERDSEERAEPCLDGRHCAMGVDEKKSIVLEHLRALHPREQQIVLLRLESGLSYREISRITGRTEGNVGNILHHAVKKLAERIGKAETL